MLRLLHASLAIRCRARFLDTSACLGDFSRDFAKRKEAP